MNPTAKILHLLRTSGKTVSTAESITTGHLQTLLGSISGASDVFKGGMTAYQLPVKVEALGVDPKLAAATNCIDEEIAQQMALGALPLFKSDYAIATCGYAELEEANPYAFMAIAQTPDTILFSGRIELTGTRVDAQKLAAETALNTFLALLQSLSSC